MFDRDAPLEHALSIDARVFDARLSVQISYNGAQFSASTIDECADAFERELREIVAHCVNATPSATPSDFPLALLDATQLAAWPMPLDGVDDIYPLSPMQRGMLFHSLYAPGDGAYVNQIRIDIDALDSERFRAAWNTAAQRHDILRTGFVQHGDGWLQWVARTASLPFAEYDWRDAGDSSSVAEKLDALALRERTGAFDFACGPLHRLTLVRTGDARHHFIWTHHHVLLDGWSVSALIGEVLRDYSGEASQAVVTVTGRSARYREYIRWLQARDNDASETFWRAQLAALDQPGRLTALAENGSSERDVSDADADSQGELRVEFDAATTVRLSAFAREERITLNTLVQAAWALLLHRHSGQKAVVFGATVAGRPADLPGAEQMLGLFINTLPVVVTVDATASVGDCLREMQTRALALREHEHTPLNDIQRWAGVTGQPLFDSIVVFENYPVDEALQDAAPGGLRFSELRNREQTNYPLTITVMPGDTLKIDWTFAREKLSTASVHALARQFEAVLNAMIADASSAVGEVAWLDADARREVEAFSRCDADYGETLPVHRVIEAQVRSTPDAQAVLFGDTALTYAELNARANQLAHRLSAQGVGPDVRVGIAVERSVEMVVGLLAIMKAGGAYVPFDPSYPAARLAYMMADSGISLLLTQRRVRDGLPLSDAIEVLELDALDLASEPLHNPDVELHGENLAYVIYTSGSTGQPKGAANRHSALYNRLVWMQQAYALDATDTVLQKTPFSFDVSVWEFFWPLMTGARLAVAAPDDHRDPQKLVELIERHTVTTLHFVPSMLQAFIAYEGAQQCSGLRRVICSGEALSTELKDRALAALPEVGLYNLYGPTEAAIDVTHWSCLADDTVTPIGRPIANVQTVVLDASLNMTPV
ncbi:condensation domain-containing protein, partial [Paraburkholderia fungorum]|uniref:condensation domain-containing protein n=1 Tax=Paraburkholderia fungorum TaxID=134537 RepID=UPI0038B740E3